MVGGVALKRNLVHALEQRELVDTAVGPEEAVHLAGSLGALQLLAVEELSLKDAERLAGLDERLGAAAVAATEASSDEVSNASARLSESLRLHVVEELEREALHLHETNAHDSGWLARNTHP